MHIRSRIYPDDPGTISVSDYVQKAAEAWSYWPSDSIYLDGLRVLFIRHFALTVRACFVARLRRA